MVGLVASGGVAKGGQESAEAEALPIPDHTAAT